MCHPSLEISHVVCATNVERALPMAPVLTYEWSNVAAEHMTVRSDAKVRNSVARPVPACSDIGRATLVRFESLVVASQRRRGFAGSRSRVAEAASLPSLLRMPPRLGGT